MPYAGKLRNSGNLPTTPLKLQQNVGRVTRLDKLDEDTLDVEIILSTKVNVGNTLFFNVKEIGGGYMWIVKSKKWIKTEYLPDGTTIMHHNLILEKYNPNKH